MMELYHRFGVLVKYSGSLLLAVERLLDDTLHHMLSLLHKSSLWCFVHCWFQVSSNGTAATTDGQTVQTAENAQDPQQQQQQPQQAPNAWQVIKGVLFRYIFLYHLYPTHFLEKQSFQKQHAMKNMNVILSVFLGLLSWCLLCYTSPCRVFLFLQRRKHWECWFLCGSLEQPVFYFLFLK